MGIARWMREWANLEMAWSHNLIALGDFNIDRQGDPLWQSVYLQRPEGARGAEQGAADDLFRPGQAGNQCLL